MDLLCQDIVHIVANFLAFKSLISLAITNSAMFNFLNVFRPSEIIIDHPMNINYIKHLLNKNQFKKIYFYNFKPNVYCDEFYEIYQQILSVIHKQKYLITIGFYNSCIITALWEFCLLNIENVIIENCNILLKYSTNEYYTLPLSESYSNNMY